MIDITGLDHEIDLWDALIREPTAYIAVVALGLFFVVFALRNKIESHMIAVLLIISCAIPLVMINIALALASETTQEDTVAEYHKRVTAVEGVYAVEGLDLQDLYRDFEIDDVTVRTTDGQVFEARIAKVSDDRADLLINTSNTTEAWTRFDSMY